MPKKTVTRLRKSCGQLAGHSRQQATRVAQAATTRFRALLPEGQLVVDLEQLQNSLGQQLADIRNQLTARDNNHQHELQVADTLRQQRDRAAKALRERMFQLRNSLDGLFGAGGSAKVFEDKSNIPEDPMALLQFVGHVYDNLVNPDFVMPEPLQNGFILDRTAAAADFEVPYLELDEAVTKLEGTESDFKLSQSEKDIHVSEAATTVGKVARFYEALYDVLGFDGLAKRVRRSTHNRNRSDDGAETDPSPETPPTEDPPADDTDLPLAA